MRWLEKVDKIEIGVVNYNSSAIELYKKLGFQFNEKKDALFLFLKYHP